MYFDTVPSELLLEICGHLQTEDIRNISLTNKRFDHIATGPLFREVTFYLATQSCDRILALVSSRGIAVLVQAIWIEPDRLDNLERVEDWHKAALKHMSSSIAPLPSTHPARQSYQEVHQNQQRAQRRAQHCIRTLLRACKKLQSIHVSTGDKLRKSMIEQARPFRSLTALDWSHQSLLHGCFDPSVSLVPYAETKRPLRSLATAPVSHGFFFQYKQAMDAIMEVMSHLVELQMQVHCKLEKLRNLDAYIANMETGNLRFMISTAANMQRLDISFPLLLGEPCLDLEYVLDPYAKSDLRSIRLRGMMCSEQSMCGLVRSQSAFRCLTLEDLSFGEGSWRSFLDTFAGRWQTVENLTLRRKSWEHSEDGGDILAFDMNDRRSSALREWDHYILCGGRPLVWLSL